MVDGKAWIAKFVLKDGRIYEFALYTSDPADWAGVMRRAIDNFVEYSGESILEREMVSIEIKEDKGE